MDREIEGGFWRDRGGLGKRHKEKKSGRVWIVK